MQLSPSFRADTSPSDHTTPPLKVLQKHRSFETVSTSGRHFASYQPPNIPYHHLSLSPSALPKSCCSPSLTVFLCPMPAYNCPVPPPPSSSALVATGAFPLNLFLISIMPRLHSPYPLLNCWHWVGSVSTSGSRMQSAALLRWTSTQSEVARHSARAAPDGG